MLKTVTHSLGCELYLYKLFHQCQYIFIVQVKLYIKLYIYLLSFRSVYWIICCPYAEQILAKLSVSYKMLSKLVSTPIFLLHRHIILPIISIIIVVNVVLFYFVQNLLYKCGQILYRLNLLDNCKYSHHCHLCNCWHTEDLLYTMTRYVYFLPPYLT
jgi:hypothetical protein